MGIQTDNTNKIEKYKRNKRKINNNKYINNTKQASQESHHVVQVPDAPPIQTKDNISKIENGKTKSKRKKERKKNNYDGEGYPARRACARRTFNTNKHKVQTK